MPRRNKPTHTPRTRNRKRKPEPMERPFTFDAAYSLGRLEYGRRDEYGPRVMDYLEGRA